MRSYFDKYKYQSIDTDVFKAYFESYFSGKPAIAEIDWQSWLYKPGMPPVIPDYDTSLAVICDELVEKFASWDGAGSIPITSDDKDKLSTFQVIYLIQSIFEKPAESIGKLQALNNVFDFDNVKNAEIKFIWLRIGLKAHWEEKVDPVLKWINVIGRMKFVRPLYRDLYNWEAMRSKAIENFKANRQNMMHVSAYTLAKDLHINE